MSDEDVSKIRGWIRMVRLDASLAMSLTMGLTICFLIAGAVILRPKELAPAGSEVALTLSGIFSHEWGAFGSKLFLLTGVADLNGNLFAEIR